MKELTDLKPLPKVTVKQVNDIQRITGCGQMHAKKLAHILNMQGWLTWEDVHALHNNITAKEDNSLKFNTGYTIEQMAIDAIHTLSNNGQLCDGDVLQFLSENIASFSDKVKHTIYNKLKNGVCGRMERRCEYREYTIDTTEEKLCEVYHMYNEWHDSVDYD